MRTICASLTGTVTNGVVVLDAGPVLPEGTKVDVAIRSTLTASGAAGLTLAERLLRHAGTVPGLPADFAGQHDHYIHGMPKR